MSRIIRSPQSDVDLFEIAAYIALDNLAAAHRLIDRVDAVLNKLVENPGAGRERNALSPKLRSFPVGNVILFYRPSDDGIELVRVLHGSRDLRQLFE